MAASSIEHRASSIELQLLFHYAGQGLPAEIV
jgi:hypothetical protein